MPDELRRVAPSEISDLLADLHQLGCDAPLADRLAWHERKASILTRIAADIDTPEAHEVAADAWHYLGKLAREADAEGTG